VELIELSRDLKEVKKGVKAVEQVVVGEYADFLFRKEHIRVVVVPELLKRHLSTKIHSLQVAR
jgi:hypothetical protein